MFGTIEINILRSSTRRVRVVESAYTARSFLLNEIQKLFGSTHPYYNREEVGHLFRRWALFCVLDKLHVAVTMENHNDLAERTQIPYVSLVMC